MGLFNKKQTELTDEQAAAMALKAGMSPGDIQQAQSVAAANKATAGGTIPQEGPDFEPVAGVSLEIFAEVSKGLAAYNYDQTKAPEIAATKGISGDDWQTAVDEWGERMKRNPAVGQRFNALYTGRA